MKWTLEVDRVVEKAGFCVQETEQGLVLRTRGDARELFEASPLHVLTLYVCCAMIGANIEADTYLAACDYAPRLSGVTPEKFVDGVQAVLMSEHPEMIAPLAAAGGFSHVGVGGPKRCLGPLSSVPANPAARWWAFLHLCGADVFRASRAMKMDEKMCRTLIVYESLFAYAPPRSMLELKSRLGRLPKFDFNAAAQALSVFAPGWKDAAVLYQKLCESGEPYRISQLAVTAQELTAAGVPARKMKGVLSQLLSAVQRTPALNTHAALLALARTLSA